MVVYAYLVSDIVTYPIQYTTPDELLPMLTDLIDKIDSNPELMMNLSIELGKLPEHLAAKLYYGLQQTMLHIG